MWLLTRVGFFSIVRKPGDAELTVRARARRDLVALKDKVPEMGPIREGVGTDYRFRATVASEPLAQAIAGLVASIQYPNFKNEVVRSQGHERARIYGDVWHALSAVSDQMDRSAE